MLAPESVGALNRAVTQQPVAGLAARCFGALQFLALDKQVLANGHRDQDRPEKEKKQNYQK